MTDFDDNQFEEFEAFEPTPPQKNGNNKNFIIAVGALVGLFLVILIGLVIFAGFVLPNANKERREQAEKINAQNTTVAQTGTAMAVAGSIKATLDAQPKEISTATLAPTLPKVATSTQVTPAATATAQATQVLAQPTDTPQPLPTSTQSAAEALGANPAARTLTVAALLTLSAGGGQVTIVPAADQPLTALEAMTSTARAQGTQTARNTPALPQTGIAEDLGLAGLVGSAILLVLVIVFARRLRMAH